MKFVNLDESEIIEKPLEKVIARPDYFPIEFGYDNLCSLDLVSVDGIHLSEDDPDLILPPSINKINNCFKSEYFKVSNLFSEIQTYEQKQEALKNLGVSNVINNSNYIYDLGKFNKQVDAEEEAVKIANNSDIAIILYYVGDQNGIIFQQVGDTITKQILLWDNTIFQRHVNFSDSSKTHVSSASSWWKLGATHISYDSDTRKFHLQDMNYENLNPTLDSEVPLASSTQDGFMSKEQAQKLETFLSSLSTKQDILSPGDGITMMNNTVSTLIGNGLTYNGREIVINHDLTLKINNGKLGVNAGKGLYVNPDNKLGINVGKGLTINHTDSMVEVAEEVLNDIADEKTRAEGVESILNNRLAVIEGEGEGSIKKALADTKIYADTKIDELDSTKTGEGTFVDVTVSQENGVITSVTVAESDIASATILAEVKEDVDNFFKDASFVENAKDTLKELQEYITSDGEAALRMEQAIADNKTAIEAEVNRAKSAENGLNNAITSETTARETAVQDIQEDVDLINETIGEVADGKTLVEMIEAAEAAAIAAATVVAENSEFITIEQTGEVGKTQTYTIKTQDIASSSDLATEISRAQEAEQGNSDAIDSIKSDYLKSSDKLELSQAIVSETEARVQAISNLEFKNSLKLDGVVQSEELLDTLPDVQSGALYSVGPDSNDRYKLYAYVNNSWTYMGYLNSSSIDITQSLGQSQNLAISQKAVTDALTPIIMTYAEFDALVSNGTITDDDLTIRYIID